MTLRLLLTAALTLTMAAVVSAEEKPKTDAEGFVSLFNGKDLSGWVNMGKDEGWEIHDGVLRYVGGKGGNWLHSEKQYKNFILKVDWKVAKNGNSGVFLRSAKDGAPWDTGYEAQISNAPRDDSHCTGSLYGYAAVNPRPDETADKWHTFVIRCEGPHVTVTSDGVKCIDFDQSKADKTKDKPLTGFVGVQDSHAHPGSYIEYRNIKIKELE